MLAIGRALREHTALAERKVVVLRALAAKNTRASVMAAIRDAADLATLEELYAPFKSAKASSLADTARAAGHEPLADKVWESPSLPDAAIPADAARLPPKTCSRNLDRGFLARRGELLEQYLQQALARADVHANVDVAAFAGYHAEPRYPTGSFVAKSMTTMKRRTVGAAGCLSPRWGGCRRARRHSRNSRRVCSTGLRLRRPPAALAGSTGWQTWPPCRTSAAVGTRFF